MKAYPILFALAAPLLLPIGCSPSAHRPETLVEDYDHAEMDRAIATARSRVDEFIDTLGKGEADSFSVKAPITQGGDTEHFWLTDVTFANGEFTGVIGNEPGVVKSVRFGQPWTIGKDEISDWMFTRGDKIHGGFTIEPLLDAYPKEQADAFRSKLVR